MTDSLFTWFLAHNHSVGEMAESDRPLAQVELFKTGLKRKYSSGEAMSRLKEKKTKATSNTTISEA